mgnify:CR=1 FL=1
MMRDSVPYEDVMGAGGPDREHNIRVRPDQLYVVWYQLAKRAAWVVLNITECALGILT